MKDTAYYIKTSIVMLLLAVESLTLTSILYSYVRTENYFSPPLKTILTVAILLLVLLFTYALSVGAWNKWEQYVVVPLPISLGIFLGLLPINPTYAIVSAVISYILLSYDVFLANSMLKILVKFDPTTILRVSTKGLLFIFSLVGGVLVLVHSETKTTTYDLGGTIANIAQEQFNMMLPKTLDTQTLPIDPEQFGMLTGMQGNSSSLISGFPINLDLRETVKAEVDAIIAPYNQFIPPLIGLLVVALIRFLGSFSHFAFMLTVTPVFGLAKKLGWFHIMLETVQKETLSFGSPQLKNPQPVS